LQLFLFVVNNQPLLTQQVMRNKNKQLLIANVHPLRLCSTILFQISKVLLIRPFPAEREKNKLWGSWERKYNCAYTNGWHV